MLIKVNSPQIGLVSDIHGDIAKLERILSDNPDITQWFCLGDIVDFVEPEGNRAIMDWWQEKGANIFTLWGNHEEVVFKELLNITFTHKEIIKKFYTHLDLLLPNNQHFLLYHSKPKDNWNFVDKIVTEREFIDYYLSIGDHVDAVCIGHNHQQFIKDFPSIHTQLWSIGAVKFGCYAVVDSSGIHLKRLKKV